MSERERIGLQIARLRQEKQLTQRDLARLTGFSNSNIAKIEKGAYSVGIDVLSKMAEALDARVELVKIKDHQE